MRGDCKPGGGGGGGTGGESGSSGAFLDAIKGLVPQSISATIDKTSKSIPVGQIGPVSVYLKGGIAGSVGCCSKSDGSTGMMFAGSVFLVIDAGVGTAPPDAVRTGHFKSGPRVGQKYFKDINNGPFVSGKWARGVNATYSTDELPACETNITVKGKLRAYLSASYLVATSTVNGNIGECSLGGGCNWSLSASASTTFNVTNVGVRAGVEFKATAQGTLAF